MRPNAHNQIALGYENSAPILGMEGLQPYECANIRLSSVLCTLGFLLRDDAQPALPIVDFETGKRQVIFFHKPLLPPDAELAKRLPKLTAALIGLWWSAPAKYSIDGYDDALLAMRRVFETREFLIGVIKGAVQFSGDGRKINRSVATESLHIASVIKACGIPLISFHQKTFVFGPKAAPIAALIAASENEKQSTRLENQKVAANLPHSSTLQPFNPSTPPDLCIDWMLWALKYRDWLGRIVRQPDCVPVIEKRDRDCFMRLRADMPKTLRREFVRQWR
jgi:hypothetical protein